MKQTDELLMWNNTPVLTTKMMAERLGLFEKHIRDNYLNNKQRFIENEDHFVIQGADLKNLKSELHRYNRHSELIDPHARYIYLWTEKGAHSQAKIAQTSEAWDAFLGLRDTYFKQREAIKAFKDAIIPESPLLAHTKRENQVANSKQINKVNFENGGLDSVKAYNTQACKLISGKYPKELKEIAKKKGYKAKQMTSGKEVLRTLKPELAATMSLTDDMCKFGAKLEDVVDLTKSVIPVFLKMKELGMNIDSKAV
jgi:hypothetical protein